MNLTRLIKVCSFAMLLSVVQLLISTTPCKAQNPTPTPDLQAYGIKWQNPQPGTGDTLGTHLEKVYTKLLNDCNVKALIFQNNNNNKKKKDPESITATSIPDIWQTHLGEKFRDNAWAQTDTTLGHLFEIIFERNDIKTYKSSLSSEWNLYGRDSNPEDQSIIGDSISSQSYSHSCLGILDAAAKASTGFIIPFLDLSNAINFELNAERKRRLVLVEGTFSSPLAEILSKGGQSSERLKALFTVWSWYNSNAQRISQSNYYLSTFHGITLLDVFEQNSNKQIDTTISGAIKALPISIKGNLSSKLDLQTSIQIRTYSTLAYLDKNNNPDVSMKNLMSASEVSQEISAFSAKLATGNNELVLQKNDSGFSPGIHKQIIEGIPSNYCGGIRWQAEAISVDGRIELLSAHPDNTIVDKSNSTATCVFELKYTPGANTSSAQGGQVEITYKITSLNDKDRALKLALNAEKVTYRTNSSPLLKRGNYSPIFTVTPNAGYKALTWKAKVDVSEDFSSNNDDSNIKYKEFRDLDISCESNKTYSLNERNISYDPSSRSINISAAFYTNTAENLDIENSALFRKCKLIGTIVFTKQGSNGTPSININRSLDPVNIEILFPGVALPKPQVVDRETRAATPQIPATSGTEVTPVKTAGPGAETTPVKPQTIDPSEQNKTKPPQNDSSSAPKPPQDKPPTPDKPAPASSPIKPPSSSNNSSS